jgi:hypothetical protein
MRIHILHGATCTPQFGHVVDMSPSEFLDLIADVSQIQSQPCRTDADKLAGEGFVLAQYREGARSKHASQLAPDSATQIFCYDVDDISIEDLASALPTWAQHDVAIYSTFKHTSAAPRLRVLVALSRPVRSIKTEYLPAYLAVAELLKISPDPSTLDGARLFFAPQHKPQHAGEVERHRFRGRPVDVDALDLKNVVALSSSGDVDFDAPGERPTKPELKKVAKNMRGSTRTRLQKTGAALEAILRGESFAGDGHRHNAQLQVAFELVRAFRRLDAAWFADKYLDGIWTDVWGGDVDRHRADWIEAVESAQKKLREDEEAATVDELPPMPPEAAARADKLRGKLVVSNRGTYYVYSPRCDLYKGPFSQAEVAIAVRDNLVGVGDVSELAWSRSGPRIKSAIELNHEYGTTVEGVTYWPRKPPQAYDKSSDSICLQAYHWVKWEPVFHEIADDLLHTIAGDHYDQFEAYLTRFRDLDQPLPALTFVGPGATWKSKICELLSRFWGSSYAPSAGRAQKIMTRFNAHLLVNPVVWSDEKLAFENFGKPQPEAYRESITSKTQAIESKGVNGIINLVSAVRHVISVNSEDKIFSNEIDADSVHATMERFLLLYTDTERVTALEQRWRGSEEMERLRSGELLCEHVVWLEKHRRDAHTSEGRLFIKPHTDAQVLLKARFGGELLNYIWSVVFRACEFELRDSAEELSASARARLPLVCLDGDLCVRSGRIHDLWVSSKAVAGAGINRPTIQKISKILTGAGFRKNVSKTGRFVIDEDVLRQFLLVFDEEAPSTIIEKVKQIKNP